MYRARLSDRGPSDRDRLFALKAFHVDLTPEQAIVFGEALQEIAAAGVSHEAVVSPLGAGLAEGVPYLACEYVAAESLDVTMRPRVALAPEVALPVVVQLAAALDAAHGQGLTHGALHPRDVLVTSDLARVGGFGVVGALERVGQRGPLRPPYAAPEQMAGADWGAAADRYALAAMAYELLTGRRAVPAGGRVVAHLERVRDEGAALRLLPVFEAAFAAEPVRRPSSAGRLADELAGALRWTGAADVRHALAGMGRRDAEDSGGGHEPERAHGASALAAGGAAPVGGGPAAAEVGGTVMRKKKRRMPWRGKQPEVDWTARALDLGPADEGAEAKGGDAAAHGVDDASDPPGPGVDSLEGAGAGDVDGPAAGGDLALHSQVDALADVAEGLDAGLRDGRGRAGAAGVGVDPAAEPEVVDGYAPISVAELESRVDVVGGRPGPAAKPEDASEPAYGSGDALAEARDAGRPGPAASATAAGGGADAADDEGDFSLTPELTSEEGYDYGLEDDAGPEDPAGDIFDRGPIDPARRLPVGLVAAVGGAVAVTAFVIGLGWMGGGGDGAPADEGASASAAAEEAGRAFSEAVVGDPASEPAPVEPAVEAGEAERPPPGVGAPAAAPARGATPAAPAAAVRRPAPSAVEERDSPPPLAPPEAAPAFAGRLLVRSMPPGAEVLVNGESRGTTPLALAELPYGVYEVEVTLAGYGSRRTQVILDEADPIGSFDADLTAASGEPSATGSAPAGSPPGAEVAIGSILAEARPPGAAVRAGRALAGETPGVVPDAPPGARRIAFRLDGTRTWTTTVEVVPATQARVAASLADAAR